MTIDPKTSAVINILIAILGGLGAYTAEFSTIFGAGVAQAIVQDAGIAALVLGGVNSILHGISSPNPGPLVKGNGNGS